MNELNGSEEEEIVTVVLEEAKEKWDCESICSKYLNIHFIIKNYDIRMDQGNKGFTGT